MEGIPFLEINTPLGKQSSDPTAKPLWDCSSSLENSLSDTF
jgi:hypothetical protein